MLKESKSFKQPIRSSSTFLCLLVLAVLTPVSWARLFIYSTGRSPKRGPQLRDGMTFCPLDSYKRGFTILCESDESIKKVKFFVDGNKVGRSKQHPFFLKGTKRGRVKKWKNWSDYEGIRTISCVRNDKTVSAATIILSCSDPEPETLPPNTGDIMPSPDDIDIMPSPDMEDDQGENIKSPSPSPTMSMSAGPTKTATPSISTTPTPSMSPTYSEVGEYPPATMILRPAGLSEGPSIVLSDMDADKYAFCDKELYPYGFSIECIGLSDTRYAQFFVNNEFEKYEGKKPYYIGGDSMGVAYAWKPADLGETFSVRCELDNRISKTVTLTNMCEEEPIPSLEDYVTVSERTGCVVIDARGTIVKEDWYLEPDGVGFRPHLEKTYIAKAGEYPLTYLFTAPATSRFAFVLDMTTRHTTEHNDVWAKFTHGGFQFMKGPDVYPDLKDIGLGFIKVYQNANRRAAIATTIDFNAHSISTREILQQGQEYEIILSGRSSKVTVHNIIFFPCEGTQCQRGSSYWKDKLEMCLDRAD